MINFQYTRASDVADAVREIANDPTARGRRVSTPILAVASVIVLVALILLAVPPLRDALGLLAGDLLHLGR